MHPIFDLPEEWGRNGRWLRPSGSIQCQGAKNQKGLPSVIMTRDGRLCLEDACVIVEAALRELDAEGHEPIDAERARADGSTLGQGAQTRK